MRVNLRFKDKPRFDCGHDFDNVVESIYLMSIVKRSADRMVGLINKVIDSVKRINRTVRRRFARD